MPSEYHSQKSKASPSPYRSKPTSLKSQYKSHDKRMESIQNIKIISFQEPIGWAQAAPTSTPPKPIDPNKMNINVFKQDPAQLKVNKSPQISKSPKVVKKRDNKHKSGLFDELLAGQSSLFDDSKDKNKKK